MIEIKDLSLTFKNADEDHEALKAVTLDIPEGCIYGFVGSNGAGKSTLLRVISGIYRPCNKKPLRVEIDNRRRKGDTCQEKIQDLLWLS